MIAPVSRPRAGLINVLTALVVCLVLIAVVAWEVRHGHPFSHEERPEEVFATKRDLFEQVIRMVSEDKNMTLTVGNGMLYAEHLPQARVQAYRDVVSAIGPQVKFSVFNGRAPSFTFQEKTIGLAIGAHFADGIDYIPPPDEQFVKIVQSVDEAKAAKLLEYWVPLSGRWYVFHTED